MPALPNLVDGFSGVLVGLCFFLVQRFLLVDAAIGLVIVDTQ
jgi:hypothetical protein